MSFLRYTVDFKEVLSFGWLPTPWAMYSGEILRTLPSVLFLTSSFFYMVLHQHRSLSYPPRNLSLYYSTQSIGSMEHSSSHDRNSSGSSFNLYPFVIYCLVLYIYFVAILYYAYVFTSFVILILLRIGIIFILCFYPLQDLA